MLINNPDSLKTWLIIVLEPLCDADSSALARYVLALLKKDKPIKELKKVMIEQLDVFLAEETKSFVDRLFNAINANEYSLEAAITDINTVEMNEQQKTENNVIPNAAEAKSADTPSTSAFVKKDQTSPLTENQAKESKSLELNTLGSLKDHPTNQVQIQSNSSRVNSSSPPSKPIIDKENQPRENRRRRASLRSRSRSRSNDRIPRRSRSRDRRQSEREKNQRQFRNKSPPSSDSRHTSSHERRRRNCTSERKRPCGVGVLGVDEKAARVGGSGDVRKGRIIRSNSRSRSPSTERGRLKCSPSNIRSNRDSPSRHHLPQNEVNRRQRCRDFDEKGYCVRGETCPWDHGINPVVFEGINNSTLIGMSLREYNPDAPDLWLRTATAPDNAIVAGNNANVLNSVTSGGINPFTGTVRPASVMVGGPPGRVGFAHIPPPGDKGTNTPVVLPGDYQRPANTGFRGPTAMNLFPFNPAVVQAPLPRELIPIPVVDAGGPDVSNNMQQCKRRFDMMDDTVNIIDGPTKRKLPLNNRLGPRILNIQNNCSLELRKVPRGLNSIAHLNNHFAKFGKIINIQISYDGDPEAAIITFSTHAEANVAYRSTEAVLNNRFIKVFWHNQDVTIAGAHTAKEDNAICSNRKNNQYHVNNVPLTPVVPLITSELNKTANAGTTATTATTAAANCNQGSSNISNTSTTSTTNPLTSTNEPTNSAAATANNSNIVASSHVPLLSLRLKNNVQRGASVGPNAIIRKKQEEQAKAVVQLANGLRKRKQELLQSYVKQMKSALELVERCDSNDPQRVKTFATIKVLQETIEKLRKEISAEQEQMHAQIQNQQPYLKKSKEQQKKELLDIELELFAQQQEGNDTTAIQKRLDELQRSLGIIPGNAMPGGGHGGNTSPNGGNKLHFPSHRISNRLRSAFPEGSTKVDRRPKTIIVCGFTKDEADFVLGHFKHFGEITKHDVDKEIPQLILSYATRINAEQAVLRGKMFKDKRLQISWAPTIQKSLVCSNNQMVGKFQNMKEDDRKSLLTNDIESADTLPELRLEDEEEEEESEDRSWRR